jgi:CBS domain-containing protein
MARNVLVREVMSTDVLTFAPGENVRSAITRLVERDVDAGPVVDDDSRVVGMLSTGDLIVQESELHYPAVVALFGAFLELPSRHRRFESDLKKALGSTVEEVMTEKPVTCGPDDTMERAATLMHDREISRLPVVDGDGRLLGLISRGDIIRTIVQSFADDETPPEA